jgi:hypothetical protein
MRSGRDRAIEALHIGYAYSCTRGAQLYMVAPTSGSYSLPELYRYSRTSTDTCGAHLQLQPATQSAE